MQTGTLVFLIALSMALPCGCSGGPVRQAESDRLTEIEQRLDYLTSELAEQRGDIDRIREKLDMLQKEAQP